MEDQSESEGSLQVRRTAAATDTHTHTHTHAHAPIDQLHCKPPSTIVQFAPAAAAAACRRCCCRRCCCCCCCCRRRRRRCHRRCRRLALPLGAEWEALLATAHAARSTALTDHTAASLAKELAIRRVIAGHSEILYPAPTHHTAKGVAQEALGKVAAELYMQEPQRLELAVEAEVALSVAQKNFTVCNGAHSAPVARVVGVLARLADATAARNE
eukprot:COSAG06_NODE_735_length_12697_cov_9.204398_14_plen_214_part_00